MPKMRRLSGKEVVKILQRLGFEIFSQEGSHIRLQRIIDGEQQRLLVAVHGNKTLKPGTTKDIYNQAKRFVSEDDLRPLFYTD